MLSPSSGSLSSDITVMMEAARTFEMSVDFHQSTRRQNPENSRLKEKLMILNFV
jgi:hypothetical protein